MDDIGKEEPQGDLAKDGHRHDQEVVLQGYPEKAIVEHPQVMGKADQANIGVVKDHTAVIVR